MGSINARQTVTLSNTAADSPAISVGNFIAGTVQFPVGMTTQNMIFHASSEVDGTFAAMYDSGSTALSITAAEASRVYQIPDAVMQGTRFIKIVPATDAPAGVILTFKS